MSSICSKDLLNSTINSFPWNIGHARGCLLLLLRWGGSRLVGRTLPLFLCSCGFVASRGCGGALTRSLRRRLLLDDKVVLDVVLVVHIHNVNFNSLIICTVASRSLWPTSPMRLPRISILLAWMQHSLGLDELRVLAHSVATLDWLTHVLLNDTRCHDVWPTQFLSSILRIARRYIHTWVGSCSIHFQSRVVGGTLGLHLSHWTGDLVAASRVHLAANLLVLVQRVGVGVLVRFEGWSLSLVGRSQVGYARLHIWIICELEGPIQRSWKYGLRMHLTAKLVLLTTAAHYVSHLASAMGLIQEVLSTGWDKCIGPWLLFLLLKCLFNQGILKDAKVVWLLSAATLDRFSNIGVGLLQILNHLSILV